MQVRIYKPAKTAMQSGQRNTKEWVLETEPAPKEIDPLMGWTSSRDTMQQVKLQFLDPGGGEGLRREERLALHRRAAQRAARETQGLRRQLRLQSRRALDALTATARRPSAAAPSLCEGPCPGQHVVSCDRAPVAQGIRATAF